MTVKDKSNFVYNGVESSDLGIVNVNIDTGMNEEIFLADSNINEIIIKGRTKPYFTNKTYQPLVFNLSFGFLEPWNDELIREVASLFYVDYYKPLYFDDDDDTIFYCMTTESSQIIHNGLKQGYVNLSFKCNDICAYSKVKMKEYNDFSEEIKFNNAGDLIIYPEIIFVKDGEGDISILNNTNNQELIITDLLDLEEIYINGDNEYIASNTQLYRYNNHNNVFLAMNTGINRLDISGISELKFQWQYKTLQN